MLYETGIFSEITALFGPTVQEINRRITKFRRGEGEVREESKRFTNVNSIGIPKHSIKKAVFKSFFFLFLSLLALPLLPICPLFLPFKCYCH